MPYKTFNLDRQKSVTLAIAAVITSGVLLLFPIRMLMADYYYNRVSGILDDKSTEQMDLLVISGETILNYNQSIKSLEKAAALDPSNSVYFKALAEIYIKLGKWAEIMQMVGAELPQEAVSVEDANKNAVKYLRRAILLEPTNPDYHLALGKLYHVTTGDIWHSGKELSRAAYAYPVNAPLRYVIANHYLLSGMKGEALEHARILAAVDDSYYMPDSARGTLDAERRTPEYLSRITGSYLFKALEIAWRVSKDPQVIKGIAPDNSEAKEAARLFLEGKGFYE